MRACGTGRIWASGPDSRAGAEPTSGSTKLASSVAVMRPASASASRTRAMALTATAPQGIAMATALPPTDTATPPATELRDTVMPVRTPAADVLAGPRAWRGVTAIRPTALPTAGVGDPAGALATA